MTFVEEILEFFRNESNPIREIRRVYNKSYHAYRLQEGYEIRYNPLTGYCCPSCASYEYSTLLKKQIRRVEWLVCLLSRCIFINSTHLRHKGKLNKLIKKSIRFCNIYYFDFNAKIKSKLDIMLDLLEC